MKTIRSVAIGGNAGYTGNLCVFPQRAKSAELFGENTPFYAHAESAANQVPKQNHVSKPNTVSEANTASTTNVNFEKSSAASSPPFGYRKLCTAIAFALTAGALLGSVYAVSHLKTDTAGSAALPSPPSGAIAQLPADTAPSTEAESVSMPPEEEDKLFKLGETQRLGDLYVDEINWLESQNSSLEAEIEVLYAESAEINRELLDLELTVIANHYTNPQYVVDGAVSGSTANKAVKYPPVSAEQ